MLIARGRTSLEVVRVAETHSWVSSAILTGEFEQIQGPELQVCSRAVLSSLPPKGFQGSLRVIARHAGAPIPLPVPVEGSTSTGIAQRLREGPGDHLDLGQGQAAS